MINPRNAGNYIFVNRKNFEFSFTFPEDSNLSSFIGRYKQFFSNGLLISTMITQLHHRVFTQPSTLPGFVSQE
jgi:hypothetical protein